MWYYTAQLYNKNAINYSLKQDKPSQYLITPKLILILMQACQVKIILLTPTIQQECNKIFTKTKITFAISNNTKTNTNTNTNVSMFS